MPLVTLREGVQPLVFPTDLSVDKQLSLAGSKAASCSTLSESSEHKTTVNCIRLKLEPGAKTSSSSSSSEKQSKNYPKLKHLSEEEATALMLKAVAEKQAAIAAASTSNNSSDRGYNEENASVAAAGNTTSSNAATDYPVSFADVGGTAGLCHLNILNSISAMNNLISGNTSAAAGGNAAAVVSVAGSSSSNNNSLDNGAGHPCPVCGRVYKLKSSLRNHQKWECGKEPQFQCPFCVYKAKQKMHIGRHMERMHKEKFQLEDDKSFITSIIGSSSGVGGGSGSGSAAGIMDVEVGVGSAAAAVAAAAAAAAALASVPELQTHFT